MNRAIVQQLIDELAESKDQAWMWIRSMYEGGFDLYQMATPVALPAFQNFAEGTVIRPILKAGRLSWRVGHQAVVVDPIDFTDPVAARVWWQTERANLLPPKAAPSGAPSAQQRVTSQSRPPPQVLPPSLESLISALPWPMRNQSILQAPSYPWDGTPIANVKGQSR